MQNAHTSMYEKLLNEFIYAKVDKYEQFRYAKTYTNKKRVPEGTLLSNV